LSRQVANKMIPEAASSFSSFSALKVSLAERLMSSHNDDGEPAG
jgi:hypothetical protein